MAFWWASQSKNYPEAISQGTLWTAPSKNGVLRRDRAIIKEIATGDVIFHYYAPFVRAVSVATAPHVPQMRPSGYPKMDDKQRDDGWVVTVDPVITDVRIHRDRIAKLLPHGAPGPLTFKGGPAQKYLSELTPEQGSRLLSEIDLDDPSAPATGDPFVPIEAITDADSRTWSRIEQRGLRRYLLAGRTHADCDLCGRQFPTALLVAGHIKPRAMCDNRERWNYPAVAMLTCLLGCDALFEHGYIAVDENGTIVAVRATELTALIEAREVLAGTKCPAFNARRAAAFRSHRSLHAARAD